MFPLVHTHPTVCTYIPEDSQFGAARLHGTEASTVQNAGIGLVLDLHAELSFLCDLDRSA